MNATKVGEPDLSSYLEGTSILDKDHPTVKTYAEQIAQDVSDPIEKAVRLYLAVRDQIRYDPYSPFHLPLHYRASFVLSRKRGFCIPKASLLCALSRACDIPCRLGFAHVKNHLATRQLLDYLGSDVFVYHAFVEFFLEGKWVKATPAFNRELCERHGVAPLEFNGRQDSLFQPFNEANQQYMEYVQYVGSYADVPVDDILVAWNVTYGTERVQGWIRMHEESKGSLERDFEKETLIKD